MIESGIIRHYAYKLNLSEHAAQLSHVIETFILSYPEEFLSTSPITKQEKRNKDYLKFSHHNSG